MNKYGIPLVICFFMFGIKKHKDKTNKLSIIDLLSYTESVNVRTDELTPKLFESIALERVTYELRYLGDKKWRLGR